MGTFIKSGCLLRKNLGELPLKTSSLPSLLLCSQAESCSVTTRRGKTDDVFGYVEFNPREKHLTTTSLFICILHFKNIRSLREH